MNNELIIYLIFIASLNIFLSFKFENYSKFFKIIDKPDNNRKLHSKGIKVMGGSIIFLNLIIFLLYLGAIDKESMKDIFGSLDNLIIFTITISIIFLLGIYDDWINLPAINKSIVLIIVLSVSLYLDKNLVTEINISFYKMIYLHKFSIFFTIFCYLVFMNAFNMLDGINLQTGLYSIFLIIFLILNKFNLVFGIVLIISIITYLKLNYENKVFLGDNGSLILSFLFSYLFITLFAQGKIEYSDEILIVLLIPGLEVFRLTVKRIMSNKSILSPDRNHIHHLVVYKNNPYKGIFIIQLVLISPYLLSLLISNNLYVIFVSLMIYFTTIYLYSK